MKSVIENKYSNKNKDKKKYVSKHNGFKFVLILVFVVLFLCIISPVSLYGQDSTQEISRIKSLIQKKEWKTVGEKLEKYITQNPLDAEGYFLLSQVDMGMEKEKDAVIHLQKALELNPQNKQYRNSLADLYLNIGEYQKAEEEYNNLLSQGEKSSKVYRQLAFIYSHRKDYDKALENLNLAIEKNPENYETYILLAKVFEEKYEPQTAIKNLETALKKGCKDKEVYYKLAYLYEDTGREEKAIAVYTAITEKYPQEMEPFKELARLYREKGDYPRSVRSWLAYHTGGAYSGAGVEFFLLSFLLILVLLPTFRWINGFFLLPVILIAGALGNVEWLDRMAIFARLHSGEALSTLCYFEITLIDGKNSHAWYQLGAFFEKRGNLQRAVIYYERAIKYDPLMSPAQYSLSKIYYHQERYKEAELAVKNAIKQEENNPLYWYQLGLIYLQEDMFAEAAQSAKQSLNLNRFFEPALDLFIESCELSGDIVLAEETVRDLIKEDPGNVKYIMELGNILLFTGRAGDSLTYFEKAIELAPDSFETWYNFGVAQREMGWLDKAIASIDQAVKIEDNSPWLLASLALTKIKNKKIKDAEKDLNKSLDIDPDSSYTHYLLGYILQNSNRKKAEHHFRIALKSLTEEMEELSKPWQKANEYQCIGIAHEFYGDKKKAGEAFLNAVKYAKVTPRGIWIFSENRLQLTPPDDFIKDCETKIRELNLPTNPTEGEQGNSGN